ncbi:thioredoxin family protein [Porifericola rhodea]|uniref:thioredoxin family protein n=1 Tax=Porifericola rhodea TaxID=930972 RepID=UPI0026654970|nr:thioredoxin family protein [Porifericola rhodea]WKN33190.1 thioredoxin family protein [Porifericola rhodea]
MFTYLLVIAHILSLLPNNQVVSVDDFTLVNAVDGKEVSLSNVGENKAVVVIFTSNYCPYAKLYDQRISNLIDTYRSKGVKFLLINPNDSKQSPAENPSKMAEKVREMGWNIPYLIDSQQKVTSLFNAKKTPQAYLLQQRGGSYQILYRGSIDDNPQVASDVTHTFLKNALDATLQGKPIVDDDTHPTGCMIKN